MEQELAVLPPQKDQISLHASGKHKSSDTKGCSLKALTMYQTLNNTEKHLIFDQWTVTDNYLVHTLLSGIKLDSNIKRFNYSAYYSALSCLLANLKFCDDSLKVLLWRRGRTSVIPAHSIEVFNNCMDYLESIGYVETKTGIKHPTAGKASMAIVLPNGSYNIEKAQLEIRLAKGAPSIELKDHDKNKIPLPTSRRGLVEVRDLSRPVDTYNSFWLKNTAELDGKRVIPFAHRVFNNESLSLGGRFYCSGFQSLPKEQRARITINGKATCEPDYSALHMHLLYAMKGIQLDYLKYDEIKDPYIVKGDFTRDTVKIVMLSLLNTKKKSDWCRNVTKSAKKEVKDAYQAWLAGTIDKKPESIKHGFIEGVPEGTNGKELLNAILDKHAPIADLIGSKDLGLQLQFKDSQIMERIIELLAAVNIPCLPVHDSIRVTIDDRQKAIEAMRTAYKVVTGFDCSID